MKLVDTNKDGKVDKGELISVFEKLAKLVGYKLTKIDLAEIGYLWSIADVGNKGELTQTEVQEILKNATLSNKI